MVRAGESGEFDLALELSSVSSSIGCVSGDLEVGHSGSAPSFLYLSKLPRLVAPRKLMHDPFESERPICSGKCRFMRSASECRALEHTRPAPAVQVQQRRWSQDPDSIVGNQRSRIRSQCDLPMSMRAQVCPCASCSRSSIGSATASSACLRFRKVKRPASFMIPADYG